MKTIWDSVVNVLIFLQKGVTHTKCIKAFCTWKIPFFSPVFLYFCYPLYSMFISLLFPPLSLSMILLCRNEQKQLTPMCNFSEYRYYTEAEVLGNDIFVQGRTHTLIVAINNLVIFFFCMYYISFHLLKEKHLTTWYAYIKCS